MAMVLTTAGKKRRVLRSSRPCNHDFWHTELLFASLIGSNRHRRMSFLATDFMVCAWIFFHEIKWQLASLLLNSLTTSPLLRTKIFWLKVLERIGFKLAVLVYTGQLRHTSLTNFSGRPTLMPVCISALPRNHHTRLSTIGDRAFPVAAYFPGAVEHSAAERPVGTVTDRFGGNIWRRIFSVVPSAILP